MLTSLPCFPLVEAEDEVSLRCEKLPWIHVLLSCISVRTTGRRLLIGFMQLTLTPDLYLNPLLCKL